VNLLKLLGVAGVLGAGIGVYVSGVVREKFGAGGGKKYKDISGKKGKVEVIEIPADKELVRAQIYLKDKPSEEG